MKNLSHPALIEHVIHLLQLLQKHQLEVDQVLVNPKLADFLLPEEIETLQTACGMMDTMPGGVLICQADDIGQVLYTNQNLLRIFQCPTQKDFQEFAQTVFWETVHPDDRDILQEKIRKQASEQEEGPCCMEYRICQKDQDDQWIEDNRRLIRSEETGSLFYIWIQDITEKKKTQQQRLNEALDKANMAVVAKNTFLTNISHDIRTPLNTIFGFTSLAKNSLYDTGVLLDYLNRIESASKKLLDMISQVLEVTALSASDQLAEVECNLCTIGQEVYDFLLPHAQEKYLTYTLDCDNLRHSGVYADPEKLKQMLLNLINNAITYTNSGGKVSVSITEGDELSDQEAVYYLRVEDTGIGISDSFIQHIFEPFSREKNSTLSGVHSIGLGLTIVKNIVDKMNGTIDAKSTENQGSVFTVTLRLRTQSLSDAEEDTEASHQTKPSILLVEDNEINREIETDLLEGMGFLIDPVEDGSIALERVKQASPGQYDLILMDLRMPVMDGWETATAIRNLPDPALSNLPIIALSASIFLEDYQKSKESGINAHLAKPLNLPVLLDTIEELTKK